MIASSIYQSINTHDILKLLYLHSIHKNMGSKYGDLQTLFENLNTSRKGQSTQYIQKGV